MATDTPNVCHFKTLRLTDLAWSHGNFGWQKPALDLSTHLSIFSMDFTLQYSDLDMDISWCINRNPRVKWSRLIYTCWIFWWCFMIFADVPWIFHGFSMDFPGLFGDFPDFPGFVSGILWIFHIYGWCVAGTRPCRLAPRISEACSADAAGVAGATKIVLSQWGSNKNGEFIQMLYNYDIYIHICIYIYMYILYVYIYIYIYILKIIIWRCWHGIPLS